MLAQARTTQTSGVFGERERQIIAKVIERSDFRDTPSVNQVVALEVDKESNLVWVRLTYCWLWFDRDWFKFQVAAIKVEAAEMVEVKQKPRRRQRQPRFVHLEHKSGWNFEKETNIVWQTFEYLVVGDTGNRHKVIIDTRGKVTCTCQGHKSHGHCYHSAAAMAEYQDWISHLHQRTNPENTKAGRYVEGQF